MSDVIAISAASKAMSFAKLNTGGYISTAHLPGCKAGRQRTIGATGEVPNGRSIVPDKAGGSYKGLTPRLQGAVACCRRIPKTVNVRFGPLRALKIEIDGDLRGLPTAVRLRLPYVGRPPLER